VVASQVGGVVVIMQAIVVFQNFDKEVYVFNSEVL